MSNSTELREILVAIAKQNALPTRDLFLIADQVRYNRGAQKAVRNNDADLPIMLRNQAE